jgi:hypothetical protein
MNVLAPLTAADRFALSLDGLCRAVAAAIAGRLMDAVMILLVWRRIKRVQRQVLGLLTRFREGRLRVQVTPRSRGGGGTRSGGALVLPRSFAWLLPLVPCEAACFAGQISTVLAEPEMVALLEAAPQARRVLAPLCRMLGISLPEAAARQAAEMVVEAAVQTLWEAPSAEAPGRDDAPPVDGRGERCWE